VATAVAIHAEALDVLFIGDDPDLAELYRLKLELDGYVVRVVTPNSAVLAARRRRPDLVFLDVSAGFPARLAMLQELRAAAGQLDMPAIVLAASSERGLQSQGAMLSACDYVVKVPVPYSPMLTDRFAS
jgi:two-component system, OmpR family, phosphate regulon response regulator PhoB